MAQTVYFNSAATYTNVQMSDMLAAMLVGGDSAAEGVLKNPTSGPGNLLAITDAGNLDVSIATGWAVVDNRLVHNTAATSLTLTDDVPTGYIVLRFVTGTQIASFQHVTSITRTAGNTFELLLYNVTTASGDITALTDARVYVKGSAEISNAALRDSAGLSVIGRSGNTTGDVADITGADGQVLRVSGTTLGFGTVAAAGIASDAITTAKILDGQVTAAKIANRTRTFSVGVNEFSALTGSSLLVDGASISAYGGFQVPTDFVSTMTVQAVVLPMGSGNLYCSHACNYAASGEAYTTHSGSFALQTVAVTQDRFTWVASMSLSSASIGDWVSLTFTRNAINANDTINTNVVFCGWLVSYTADS